VISKLHGRKCSKGREDCKRASAYSLHGITSCVVTLIGLSSTRLPPWASKTEHNRLKDGPFLKPAQSTDSKGPAAKHLRPTPTVDFEDAANSGCRHTAESRISRGAYQILEVVPKATTVTYSSMCFARKYPLHAAANDGSAEKVRESLGRGVGVNCLDSVRWSPSYSEPSHSHA
jgi:hypothetical protein